MKKILIILSLFIIFYIPNVFAGSVCDSLSNNNSKATCESNSSCRWVWYSEEAGSGFCTLKVDKPKCEDLSDEEKANSGYCSPSSCSYSIEIQSFKVPNGGKATCKFTIQPDLNNKNNLTISWQSPAAEGVNATTGTLNQYQESFLCVDKSINFYNDVDGRTDLPRESLELNGDMIAIPAFKNRFNETASSSGKCPSLAFVNFAGNHYVYFKDDFKDEDNPPYSTGGSQDAQPPDEENPEMAPDEEGKIGEEVGTCETIPAPIKEYINQALKLIRWIGLAAMIILGVLDFTKAVASDDQDALKKAWGHFTKRLIAVIILFLLPLLINLIFDLIDITTCDLNQRT